MSKQIEIAVVVKSGCVVGVYGKNADTIKDVEVIDCDGDNRDENTERAARITDWPDWKTLWGC